MDRHTRETFRAITLLCSSIILLLLLYAPNTTAWSMDIIRDCTNCPAMVSIKGSDEFEVGAIDNAAFQPPNTLPPNPVADELSSFPTRIKPFLISQTEITIAEYRAFLQDAEYRETPDGCYSWVVNTLLANWKISREVSRDNPGFSQSSSDPVVCVTAKDASAYAEWLSRKTHKHYRLPTLAEWEFVARAGTESELYWGRFHRGSQSNICAYENISDASRRTVKRWSINCRDPYSDRTSPAGSFKPSPQGLYDILGNVREFVSPCDTGDTTALTLFQGFDCDGYIIKGGSFLLGYPWLNPASFELVRSNSANRFRAVDVGFRVVLEMSPEL